MSFPGPLIEDPADNLSQEPPAAPREDGRLRAKAREAIHPEPPSGEPRTHRSHERNQQGSQ